MWSPQTAPSRKRVMSTITQQSGKPKMMFLIVRNRHSPNNFMKREVAHLQAEERRKIQHEAWRLASSAADLSGPKSRRINIRARTTVGAQKKISFRMHERKKHKIFNLQDLFGSKQARVSRGVVITMQVGSHL